MVAKTKSFLPLAYWSVMRAKSASERTSSKTIWRRWVTRASSWPMVVTPRASRHPAVDAAAAVAQDGVHGVGGTGQAEVGGEVGDFSGVFQSAHSSSRNSFTPS